MQLAPLPPRARMASGIMLATWLGSLFPSWLVPQCGVSRTMCVVLPGKRLLILETRSVRARGFFISRGNDPHRLEFRRAIRKVRAWFASIPRVLNGGVPPKQNAISASTTCLSPSTTRRVSFKRQSDLAASMKNLCRRLCIETPSRK